MVLKGERVAAGRVGLEWHKSRAGSSRINTLFDYFIESNVSKIEEWPWQTKFYIVCMARLYDVWPIHPNSWQGGFWPTWGDRRRESRKKGEANVTLGKHNNKKSVVQRANAVVLGTETRSVLLFLNTELLFLNLKCYFSPYLVISAVSEPLFLQILEDLRTTWPKVHLEIRTNWVFDLWFYKLVVLLAKLIPYIT